MTRPVLVGVDGSSHSRAAARWAADEAAARRVPLRLVHAWPWFGMDGADDVKQADLQAAARRMLAELRSHALRRHPDLEVMTSLALEEPVDGLVAEADHSDLLVLGSRGLGGFQGLLVGSVGLAVAARAETPVVLVQAKEPVPATTDEGPAVPEIVVGVDTRSPADAVLHFAFREATLRRAPLRVVHGWNLPPTYGYAGWVPPETELKELGALEAELLTEALELWRERFPGTEVIEDVRPGGAAHALVSASLHAALVVVGRRTRPHRPGPRLGPVVHAVIHHAKAPTAVVPHI